MNKEIIIAGGTGLVGKRLTEILIEKKYSVTILTRSANQTSTNTKIKFAKWDIDTQEIDFSVFKNATAIVNLTGESVIGKRWTKKQKQVILDSRVNSSKTIINALQKTDNNIESIVNASAIGWYKPQTEQEYTSNNYQENQEANNDFLGVTCKAWEDSIEPVTLLHKRLVKLRIGIVFSKHGGAIKEFLQPIKFGIAAILGNQKISWIHVDDLCNLIIESIENKNYNGVYNAVAPSITTNKELNILLAKQKKGKWFLPVKVPNFIIKLLLGEMCVEVLKSSIISCKKLLDAGFNFTYNTTEKAVEEVCG